MTIRSNVRWTALAQVARVGYQLLGLLILSRLLPPDAFGLVAMGAVVTNFANLVRDLGTAAAVIQRKELSHETTATAFWISVVAGCVIGALVVASSPLLAAFFRRSELVPLLIVLAVSFPLTGLGSVHQALLERDSRFPEIARIEVLSGAVGLMLAIVAALAGAGPYSLAFQAVSVAAMSTLQLWRASRWRPKGWYWRRAEVKEIWGFSGGLIGFNIVNYFSRNADSMIIGRVLGGSSLGAYSLAYRLMLFPVQNLTHVLTRAMFPVFSRKQEDPNLVGSVYLRIIRSIAVITAPLMMGVFALRDLIVVVVLGGNWTSVAVLLTWLAPVGFIQSILSTTGTVFMAAGRTDVLFRVGIASAVLQVIGFIVGIRWGAEGIAISYLVTNFVISFPAMSLAVRNVDRTLVDVLKAIAVPMMCAIAAGFCVMLARNLWIDEVLSPLPSLLVSAAIGSLIYATLYILLTPSAIADLRKIFRRHH